MEIKTVSGPAWPNVHYFSTTRQGGVSQGDWAGLNLGQHCGDHADHLWQNRALLRQQLPSEPHWLQQVHGTGLYRALRPITVARSWEQAAVADAAWTTAPNTVLAILTADCLPVVIANTAGTVLGVAHAGWRGLATGVLLRLFKTLQAQASIGAQWQAWIGPAISQSHFEVDQDVLDIFHDTNNDLYNYFSESNNKNKYFADLAGIAQHQLLNMAKNNIQITQSNRCTYTDEENYYSYRRQGSTGRIATLAWLK